MKNWRRGGRLSNSYAMVHQRFHTGLALLMFFVLYILYILSYKSIWFQFLHLLHGNYIGSGMYWYYWFSFVDFCIYSSHIQYHKQNIRSLYYICRFVKQGYFVVISCYVIFRHNVCKNFSHRFFLNVKKGAQHLNYV